MLSNLVAFLNKNTDAKWVSADDPADVLTFVWTEQTKVTLNQHKVRWIACPMTGLKVRDPFDTQSRLCPPTASLRYTKRARFSFLRSQLDLLEHRIEKPTFAEGKEEEDSDESKTLQDILTTRIDSLAYIPFEPYKGFADGNTTMSDFSETLILRLCDDGNILRTTLTTRARVHGHSGGVYEIDDLASSDVCIESPEGEKRIASCFGSEDRFFNFVHRLWRENNTFSHFIACE